MNSVDKNQRLKEIKEAKAQLQENLLKLIEEEQELERDEEEEEGEEYDDTFLKEIEEACREEIEDNTNINSSIS